MSVLDRVDRPASAWTLPGKGLGSVDARMFSRARFAGFLAIDRRSAIMMEREKTTFHEASSSFMCPRKIVVALW